MDTSDRKCISCGNNYKSSVRKDVKYLSISSLTCPKCRRCMKVGGVSNREPTKKCSSLIKLRLGALYEGKFQKENKTT